MKILLVGILTFFAVGIPLECVLDGGIKGENSREEKRVVENTRAVMERLGTADRLTAAKKDGEAVPMIKAEPGLPKWRPASRENCTAGRLHHLVQPPMRGTVTRVVDGDTLHVNVEGVDFKVRLWGIDAPEHDQQEGPESTRQLSLLTPPNSQVTVYPLTMDRYGRVIGNVGTRGSDWAVNIRMVAQGWAYHYRETSARNSPCLLEAERAARDSRQGVWKDGAGGGVRPWEQRRHRKESPSL